jgi:uncharacterized protein
MIKRMLMTQFILSFLAVIGHGVDNGTVLAAGPSFECSKVEKDSIEELICKDDELSALDQKMAGVYAAAIKKAVNEHPPVLKAEQLGWIKARNGCWIERTSVNASRRAIDAASPSCKRAIVWSLQMVLSGTSAMRNREMRWL